MSKPKGRSTIKHMESARARIYQRLKHPRNMQAKQTLADKCIYKNKIKERHSKHEIENYKSTNKWQAIQCCPLNYFNTPEKFQEHKLCSFQCWFSRLQIFL